MEALDVQGGSSEGAAITESLHMTAREMDRQTSVGHFPTQSAMRYLEEIQAVGHAEPQYYNLAIGDDVSSGSQGVPRGSNEPMVLNLPADGGLRGRVPASDKVESTTGLFGRAPQSSGDDFRGESLRRHMELPSGGVSQGLPLQEAVGTLQPGTRSFMWTSTESAVQKGEQRQQLSKVSELSTEEIKARLRGGQNDPEVIMELVRRLEEVELKSRSSSLHSAVEFVHSSRQQPQRGHVGRRESEGVEVWVSQAQGQPGSSLPRPRISRSQSLSQPYGLPPVDPSTRQQPLFGFLGAQPPQHLSGFLGPQPMQQPMGSQEVQGAQVFMGSQVPQLPQQLSGLASQVPQLPQQLSGLGSQVPQLPQQSSGLGSQVPQLPQQSSGVGCQVAQLSQQLSGLHIPQSPQHLAFSQFTGVQPKQSGSVVPGHSACPLYASGVSALEAPKAQNWRPVAMEAGRDQQLGYGTASHDPRTMHGGRVGLSNPATALDLLAIDNTEATGQASRPTWSISSPMSLMDMDPIPITQVATGRGVETAPAVSTSLIDVFDAAASAATPFVPPKAIPRVPGLDEGNEVGTPRTPNIRTSGTPGYTPGGTRVPEGPPPATLPHAVSFGPVTTTQLPASPISPPPLPPGYPDLWTHGTGLEACSGVSEEPSRLVHHLPGLEVGDNKSVATGDWLARIAPVMRSLSPSSNLWWAQVTAAASGFYDRWLHADPLQKLGIKSEAIGFKMDYGGLSRIEERGSILLLQALPTELQSEAVSVRGLSSAALLFLTMTRYQPGGSSEKSMILSYLTQPYLEGPNNIANNHAALRKWERLYRRGSELGLQSPDPILLVRGLDTLGRIIHNKSPTSAFTVSTFRHRYQLDSSPTEATVMQYCQLLTAELETLSLMGLDVKQQRVAALAEPSAKAPKGHGQGGKGNSPGPLNEEGVCRFLGAGWRMQVWSLMQSPALILVSRRQSVF